MNDEIKKIIEYATYAPSGENAQPWKFIINGNKVLQLNLEDRDQSLYNWRQRASYMANGAAFENIKIAATNFGYSTKYVLFPNSEDNNLIAEIEFIKDNPQKDNLFKYIQSRCTNRKPYDNRPLEASQIKELKNSISDEEINFYFTQEKDQKVVLGKVGSANEVVMLNNKYLHNFFFNHISWNKEEDQKNKIGFFIDTLELPPPAKVGFKVFSNWNRAKYLNKIGFNKIVGKQNAAVNSAAAGFGILTIKDNSPKSFVNVGRALERLWLTATKMDLSIQPLTGVLFFMFKIKAQEVEKFSAEQINIIRSAYNNIHKIFNLSEKDNVVFMFRIGYGEKPTARSSKFSVNEIIEIKK